MSLPRRAVQQVPAEDPEPRWPLVVFPRSPAARSGDWAPAVRGCAERYLPRLGSVLFRGFEVLDAPAFRRWVAALGAPLLEPWGSSCLVREECGLAGPGGPGAAGEAGTIHHAYSHTARWPAKLWLFCPAQGPEALCLVDGRDVWQRLPEQVRRRLAERGLAYEYRVQPEASMSAAEQLARFRAHGLSCQVNELGGVEARQLGPVVLTHSATRELTWFNQAHLFPAHADEGSPATVRWRDAGGSSWSVRVRHADGGQLEPSLLVAVHDAFEQSRLVVPWEPGDVLLLDNELTAHGWQLCAGQRAPDSAMADLRSLESRARSGAAEAGVTSRE